MTTRKLLCVMTVAVAAATSRKAISIRLSNFSNRDSLMINLRKHASRKLTILQHLKNKKNDYFFSVN